MNQLGLVEGRLPVQKLSKPQWMINWIQKRWILWLFHLPAHPYVSLRRILFLAFLRRRVTCQVFHRTFQNIGGWRFLSQRSRRVRRSRALLCRNRSYFLSYFLSFRGRFRAEISLPVFALHTPVRRHNILYYIISYKDALSRRKAKDVIKIFHSMPETGFYEQGNRKTEKNRGRSRRVISNFFRTILNNRL